jgi:hypothetical protein
LKEENFPHLREESMLGGANFTPGNTEEDTKASATGSEAGTSDQADVEHNDVENMTNVKDNENDSKEQSGQAADTLTPPETPIDDDLTMVEIPAPGLQLTPNAIQDPSSLRLVFARYAQSAYATMK